MAENPSVKQVQVLHETVKGSASKKAQSLLPLPDIQSLETKKPVIKLSRADSKYLLDAS